MPILRFSSLKHARSETRRTLRLRLRRNLSSPIRQTTRLKTDFLVNDETLLQLLALMEAQDGSDIRSARVLLDPGFDSASNGPRLQELLESGWLRQTWGRLWISVELQRSANAGSLGEDEAFTSWRDSRYVTRFTFPDSIYGDKDLSEWASQIVSGTVAPRNIGCLRPGWVAARLWEKFLSSSSNGSAALRRWVDRWSDLGRPHLVPSSAWSEDAAAAFRDAALEVLEFEAGFVGWEGVRRRFANEQAQMYQTDRRNAELSIPSVPSTLVDRLRWIESPACQHPLHASILSGQDISSLIHLLLTDVDRTENASAPHPLFSKVLSIATLRPELLFFLVSSLRTLPTLLADMLLDKASSASACLLVSQWSERGGAWDRALTRGEDEIGKMASFLDSVSVTSYLLQENEVPPAEFGSLLRWIHYRGKTREIGDSETMRQIVLSALRDQTSNCLEEMVVALLASIPASGLGSPEFSAALDVIDAGQLADRSDPAPLLNAYTDSVSAGEYSLSVHRIQPASASTLFALAIRAEPLLRERFLRPVDVASGLAERSMPEANPYSITDRLARSLRAHIRVLCRAIAYRTGEVSAELLEAAVDAIRAGALDIDQDGQVDAFSAQHEAMVTQEPLDRPISSDLGAALHALRGEQKEILLSSILEIKEPLVLAQLLEFAPYDIRVRIERRIAELAPSNAGHVYSLTAVQARIDELLTAGAADAAAQFLELERNLETMGKVPGREFTRLRNTLRLYLLRKQWQEIKDARVPDEVAQFDRSNAEETIRIFQALAELQNPAGDRTAAERAFSRLRDRHQEVPGYAINVYAARTLALLGDNRFTILEGAQAEHTLKLLEGMDEFLRNSPPLSDADLAALNLNRAIVTLALGEPRRAFDILAGIHSSKEQDAVLYRSVALFRMGDREQAIAVLNVAEEQYGSTVLIEAAREHILSGTPYPAPVSTSEGDNPVLRIGRALMEFSRLDPDMQASALGFTPVALARFLTDQMRDSSANLMDLVSMMRTLGLDTREDDITAVLKAILRGRLMHVGWSVEEQVRGGRAASGGPGERDLVVVKGSTTLAIIEAVICNDPVSRQSVQKNLRKHFQRLLAYGKCSVYFYVVYARTADQKSILEFLKNTAKNDATPGFSYLGFRPFSPQSSGSGPRAGAASYRLDGDEIQVVFLVLDLLQQNYTEAGIIAHS
jgi:hypothetical protein